MNKHTRALVGAAALAMVLSAPSLELFALGFRNPDQGAAATAQGNAFVAQADDPTAIYYNPAGLTQIHGTEIANGGDFSFPDARLKGGGPGTEMTKWSLTPHLYGTTDFGIPKSPWRFGIGVNVPFGSEAAYSQNGPFRYTLTSASLRVINIQPTVAYKFNDQFSLGAGLNVYDVSTGLNGHRATPFMPANDTRFHFDGNGLAEGATAGLLWKITPRNTVGIAYHSPFTVNYHGTVDVKVPGVLRQENVATASMPFPQTVAWGYAFRPIPQWKLEADMEWTNWKPLRELTLQAPGSQADGSKVPFNWTDSFLYEVGTQYDLNKRWKLRAGYIFSENSTPGKTFSPATPDSDRHVFNVGFGYSTKRMFVDVLYQYTVAADRTVNNDVNPAVDGTWLINNNAVMMTSGLRF
ncbi:MAG TPA: outer membrane protein transport protein [Verrucomicrobiae bacterium]|nr:outer membrane protein transport protein [Verrucomicrobiae bacterium]